MLKYVNTDVVFQEIPDEVTLAINISGCPCHCPGCHSQYLWQDIGRPLTPNALESFIKEFGQEITCVCFMGGDADPQTVNHLAQYIHTEHPSYKTAWYSGRTRVPSTVCKSDFDYIKTGPYLRHLGTLRDRTTNQRLYKRAEGGAFTDITSRFWS